jgi:hypothetical protein
MCKSFAAALPVAEAVTREIEKSSAFREASKVSAARIGKLPRAPRIDPVTAIAAAKAITRFV